MTALNPLRNANLLMVEMSRAAASALEASRASGRPVTLTLAGAPKPASAERFGAPAQRSSIAFESIFSKPMTEPGGSAGEKQEAALPNEAGAILEGRANPVTPSVTFDEIGRYAP